MRRVAREPVLTAAVLIPALTWLAAYLGLDLDPGVAAWIAGAVLTVGGLVARQVVTPVNSPKTSDGTPLVPEVPPVPPATRGR